ncbi:MAG TPA: right-handed parallel beta-helix repeat-containing protein [Verrucomicrobiota bacterium]|nr:right-handed parallel beta-helix repeat-containing protein [Verrucomicrobiota bacterium]
MNLRQFTLLCLASFVLSSPQRGHAQPSGGPYGPVQQTYTVPTDAKRVHYVSPDGKADATGTTLDQPTTLESAIARVVTGDAIILRGGTYRMGGLKLNQGITMQPYADERPVLKGTRVADKWESLRGGVWRTSWKTLFPEKPADWWQRNREGMRTPLHRFNNDMVFVDGRMLQSAAWEGDLGTNSFFIDYENGHVFVGINPSNRLIEITAFDSALVRTTADVHGKKSDRIGPVIRGVTFTQYAYRALEVEGFEPEKLADPATFGKDVVGSTFENVTITHCSRVAGYFRGDKTVFRNCLISDTSTEGIYILSSSDCLLERNVFARNNVEQITGYYPSAVKIFNQTRRVVCRDNVVIDQPYSNGIWYDVGNQDGVFINNWIEGALDGFFFEISSNAICAGNVFVDCDKGVRVLNAANVHVYQNTFVNTVASFERTERSAVGDHFGWHPSTGPDVDEREGHIFVGNLLTSSDGFSKAMLRVEQSRRLCGKLTRTPMNSVDGNVYVRDGEASERALIVWGPVEGDDCMTDCKNLDELRKISPGSEAGGLYLNGRYGSVFNGPELKNYTLNTSFERPGKTSLPETVRQLLNWPKQDSYAPGAYQPRR